MPFRRAALDAMVRRFGWATSGPVVWAGMDAADWDAVPQPIRAVAFIRMARDRAGVVGRGLPVSRQRVADTLGAIIATESWFEHRAVNENPAGDRDLGIGQASAFCRRVLRRLTAAGVLDCGYRDDEYADPWKASHAAAAWFGLMLDEAHGDSISRWCVSPRNQPGPARRGGGLPGAGRSTPALGGWLLLGSPSWRYFASATSALLADNAAGPAGEPERGGPGALRGSTSPSQRPVGDSRATPPPSRNR